MGRFISADAIVPSLINTQDGNRYSSVRNSPVVLSDPTGHCAFDSKGNYDGKTDCSLAQLDGFTESQHQKIAGQFNGSFQAGDRKWTPHERALVLKGANDFADKIGGYFALADLLGNFNISLIRNAINTVMAPERKPGDRLVTKMDLSTGAITSIPTGIPEWMSHMMLTSITIEFFSSDFRSDQYTRWSTVHELAHATDRGDYSLAYGFTKGEGLTFYASGTLAYIKLGRSDDMTQTAHREYFAEGVALWVYPQGDGQTRSIDISNRGSLNSAQDRYLEGVYGR